MTARTFGVLRPRSLEQAIAFASEPSTRFVAGGTALQLEWARGEPQPGRLIDLGGIAGLDRIGIAAGGVRIGALATLGTLRRHGEIAEALPLLASALSVVAGPAVRTLATIGGNIAGRTGCLLPALLALDARLEIFGPRGGQTIPLLDWLRLEETASEVVAAIVIPVQAPDDRWMQRKIGMRAVFTPSVIGVAGVIRLDGERVSAARLAVGGGMVHAARLSRVEGRIERQAFEAMDWAAVHDALLSEIDAPDDGFRSGRYRRHAAANAMLHGFGARLPMSPSLSRKRFTPKAGTPSAGIPLGRAGQFSRWHVRPDGPAKVEGSLAYLTDRRDPGMLLGRILRAGVPHARIVAIDTSAAEALPGVAAVVTHRDVGGQNAFGIVVQDQPALCFDKVRYVGDAIAAVAAIDDATAERAIGLIRVDYEPLPVVSDPEGALAPGAERVHACGNLQCQVDYSRGDADAGFAMAAHVVEATYVTPRQMHGFMETEGGHALIEPDGTLVVAVGGQHGARDRLQLSRILDIPEEKIRVVTSPTGGAFGGKDELTVQPALALLALKAGRPVRLQLDRAESVAAGTKRNPMTIRMRTACDAEGRLLAQRADVVADAGAYASLGPAVVETALEHASGPYVIPNVSARGRLAYTNNGVCGAFRGFGANQMAFAVECQIERLAQACRLSPIEIRRRNLRRPGTSGPLRQKVAPSERLAEMLDAAETDPLWRQPRGLSRDCAEIVGVGMAMNYQGNGLGTLVPDPGGGILRLAADGKIEALYGLDEMGQGLLTSIQAAVARELGCSRDDVRPVTGDTRLTPDSGSTTASRGTYVVWKVAETAGPLLAGKLLAAAAGLLGREASGLAIAPGGIGERGSNSGELLISFRDLAAAIAEDAFPSAETAFEFPKSDYTQGNARFIFASGAVVARVAVNRITGQPRVLDLTQHTAAGPVLDVASYLGQIEGGGVQGLGFTLTEDAAMAGGRYLAGNLDTYMLPSIADAPLRMRVHALEELDPGDPYGPRGAGELGIGAVTPAIVTAIADALGFWPQTIPISPEALLDRMAGGE